MPLFPFDLPPAFTTAQARELGLTPKQLGRMPLERVLHGVYLRSEAIDPSLHPSEFERVRHLAIAHAVASRFTERHFLSNESAALMWGLPMKVSRATPVHIGSFEHTSRLHSRGLRSTLLKPELTHVVQNGKVRLTSPAVTWAMLAPAMNAWDAVALGDAALRQHRIPGTDRLERPALTTLAELRATVEMPHRRHRQLLASYLSRLSPHSASPPETHLRLWLTSLGFPPEALDFDVFDGRGVLIGCSEIAYPSRQILFEYEGDHHRTHTSQWNRDIEKYASLNALGWKVVRVTAEMLYRQRSKFERYVRGLFAE